MACSIPSAGEIFQESLQRIEHELYLADKKDGVTRTAGQRRAAALIEMAIRAQTAPKSGLRPRPLITILCGEQTFGRVCELAGGVVIAPGQIVPLLSDADIERIVFDGPDRVIGVSRRRRFTGALRRAIEVRDRHCQHPSGCDVPASRCDVDHIQPYTDGGITSHDDGQLECDVHNRDHKKHNLRPKDPPAEQLPLDEAADDPPDQRPPPETA